MSGNKAVASVYIDTDAMDDYYNVTGYQVADWANRGLHGGLDTGGNTPHVWDDTLDETVNNGELLELAVLWACGEPLTSYEVYKRMQGNADMSMRMVRVLMNRLNSMALSVSKSRSFCQAFQSSVWSRFLSEKSKWTLDSVRKYL